MKLYRVALLAVLSCSTGAWATPLTFVTPISVTGFDNVFLGPSFTVNGNFDEFDTLSLRAEGTVDLAFGNFTTNAAGVIISPATTNTGAHPGEITLSNGFPYAALLFGNAALGFHPVFPLDASTGFGSATPPSVIEIINRPLGAIFGAGVTIADGDTLEFRVNDINFFDNSGSYTLSQAVTAVPEPTTVITMGLGLMAMAALGRRWTRA